MEPINRNTHMKNIGAKVDVTKINELVGDSDVLRGSSGSGRSGSASLQRCHSESMLTRYKAN